MSGLKHRQEFVGPKYQRVPSEDGTQSFFKAYSSWKKVAKVAGKIALVLAFCAAIAAFGMAIHLITQPAGTPVPLENITELISLATTPIPRIVRQSGVLPVFGTLFILKRPGSPNSQPIDVTLPANMTAYVGKRITVCAVRNQYATLTLLGGANYWTGDPYWTTIQFGLPNATGICNDLDQPTCCITFDVMTASSVNVISKSSCTLYCTNINQWHCVDPSNPYQTNPWHGWWKLYVKSSSISSSYIFVDMRVTPPSMVHYTGTVRYPRELTEYDAAVYNTENGIPIAMTSFNSIGAYTSVDGQSAYDYTMQQNQSMIVCSLAGPNRFNDVTFELLDAYGGYSSIREGWNLVFGIWTKVSPSQVPAIIPASTGRLPTDVSIAGPDDPLYLFKYIVDVFLSMSNAQVNSEFPAQSFIGVSQATTLKNTIETTGVTFSTPIVAAYPTQAINLVTLNQLDSGYETVQGITVFDTAVYPHVIYGPVLVTVSGFTGAWASVNGIHKIVPTLTSVHTEDESAYKDMSTTYSQATVKQRVVVYLDTSDTLLFPRLQDGSVNMTLYGYPVLTVSYGPITSDTEFGPFYSAIVYWTMASFKHGIHLRFPQWLQPTVPPIGYYEGLSFYFIGTINVHQPVYTWAEVQTSWSTPSARGLLIDISGRQEMSTSWFAFGDPENLYIGNANGAADVTGRFGIRPDLDLLQRRFAYQAEYAVQSTFTKLTYEYSVTNNNYLTGVRVPVFKMVGTSRSELANYYAQFFFPGGEGDEFDIQLIDPSPITSPVPPLYSYYNRYARFNDAPNLGYPPYSDDPIVSYINSYVQSDAALTGFIKSSLLPANLTIGYMRVPTASLHDSFKYSFHPAFDPAVVYGNSSDPYRGLYTYAKIMATQMQYLVDGGADHIIFDIRFNDGGTYTTVPMIRQLFGTDTTRPTRTMHYSKTGYTPSKLVDSAHATYGFDVKTFNSVWETVNPNLMASLFPGGRFSGGNVVFLTDADAGSSGDIYPNLFLGQNLDRQLGGSTEVKFVGSFDGRNTGTNGRYALGVAAENSRCYDASQGYPISCIPYITPESSPGILRTDNTPLFNHHPALRLFNSSGIPNRIAGLNGGNALPADWEHNVYPALGYVPNPYVPLTGWTHPQTPLILSVGNVHLTPKLSSTPFSMVGNVLTVTSLVAHGYSAGDSVAINGGGALPPVDDIGSCSGFLISQARPIASVINSTAFTISLGTDCDVGPTPIVGGSSGIIEIKNRAQWRDHWLEQAIRVAIAAGPGANPGAKRQTAPLRSETKHASAPVKKTILTAQASMEKYGVNILCPASSRTTLLSPQAAPFSDVTITIPARDRHAEASAVDPKRTAALKQLTDHVHGQIMAGGLCVDSNNGKLMATASYSGRPHVVHESNLPSRPAAKKRSHKKKMLH